MYRIVLRPQAEADIQAAAVRYEQESPQAAANFWRAVEQKLRLVEQNPYQYQRVFHHARRVRLSGFQYSLFYTVNDDEILIICCTHSRRHPKRWQDPIPE